LTGLGWPKIFASASSAGDGAAPVRAGSGAAATAGGWAGFALAAAGAVRPSSCWMRDFSSRIDCSCCSRSFFS